MPLFEVGTTFLDHRAINIKGTNPKYFLALNNADDKDDIIVSFVFNTEHRMDLYHVGCNKEKQKFVVAPKSFSFISDYSSIMLAVPTYYQLEEIIDIPSMKIFEKANDKLLREIKNCLDMKNVSLKFHHLIKDSFK